MGLNQRSVIPFKRALRSLFKYERAPLRGSIDTVHNGCCQGWALDAKSTSPVEVELFIDGQLAGRALACIVAISNARVWAMAAAAFR